MVKKNKPELTDEQAWSVVQAVDQAGSLQGENERDMLVWTSETDSEWDEERIRRERNLAGAGGS